MAKDPVLSAAEVDILFAAQGAEMEAMVELARFELEYNQQRLRLISNAERAAEMRGETFSRVVKVHGFDPEEFEADIEAQRIAPKNALFTSIQSPSESREEEMERKRSSAVSLRPMEDLKEPQDGQ